MVGFMIRNVMFELLQLMKSWISWCQTKNTNWEISKFCKDENYQNVWFWGQGNTKERMDKLWNCWV